MSTLDGYLTMLPGRCQGCGYDTRTQGCRCNTADEWKIFTAALRAVAVGGRVHQAAVRPRIRGRIKPKHIGQMYARARREGLLVEVTREKSDDTAGRNTHHLEPVYELRDAA